MKSSFRKKSAMIGLSALCAAGLVSGALLLSPGVAKAETYQAEVQGVNAGYVCGDSFTVPSAKITVGETQVDATYVHVRFPDGVYYEHTAFVLTQVGEYTLTYNAVVNDKTVVGVKKFTVNKSAYSVSDIKSSVGYVSDLVTTSKADDGGIKFSIAEGDEFVCNKVLDVSESDTITPIVTIHPYSMSLLAENVNLQSTYTVVKLTDYYNPDNFVEVSIGFYVANTATGRLHPYVVAGANTQPKSGLEPNLTGSAATGTRRNVTLDGQLYRTYYGVNDYGTCMDNGAPGTNVGGLDINNGDDYGFSVYYESSTNRIYVKHKTMHFVTDLDESAIFDRNLFGGFTTGEVILSVYSDKYVTSVADYEISQIYGARGEELNASVVLDEVAPQITLSNDNTGFNIALDEPFEIFSAMAKDLNLVGDVNAYVYYEYGTPIETAVPLKDGKFVPHVEGEYSIVYVASDSFGNESKRIVKCNCIQADDNKIVSLDKGNIPQSISAGETVVIPECTVSTYNKSTYVRIYASFNGVKKEIDAQSRAFFPENVGTYKLIYEYGDEVKNYVEEVQVVSLASDNVAIRNIELPHYMIKGARYTLDKVYAETYRETYPKLVTPEIYVSEDGKAYVKVNYSDYTVNATSTVQFKYTYEGKELKVSQVVPVVDVTFGGRVQMKEYFVGDFTTSAASDGITLLSNKNSGENTFEFINPVSLSNFEFKYKVPATSFGFSGIDITLTDVYDSTNSLVISYDKVIGGTAFSVNGSPASVKTFALTGGDQSIRCDAKSMAIVDENQNVYYIQDGFKTDRAYLTVTLRGINSQSAIKVNKICNQVLSNVTRDSVEALMALKSEIGGIASINEKVTIQPIDVIDILSPYCDSRFTFEMYDEKGNYVTSDNGVVLDGTCSVYDTYEVTFKSHGVFTAEYVYYDQAGRKASKQIDFYVYDRVCPVVTLNGVSDGATVLAGLNKTVNVASYTASDNGGSYDIQVYVISPENVLTNVTQTKKFVADKKGEWKVLYYAIDADGNSTLVSYTIKIS